MEHYNNINGINKIDDILNGIEKFNKIEEEKKKKKKKKKTITQLFEINKKKSNVKTNTY
tara:strand:+ start:91 stop:267 length:177 start_codon:yes stop_codon:yes gene_type:complete